MRNGFYWKKANTGRLRNIKRILAVDALTVKDKKILLIKRRFAPFKGFWALPGGLVEKNETIKQALIREAKEETGLDIIPVRLVGIYDEPERDPRGIVSVAFLCKPKNAKTKPGEEVLDVKFFPLEEAVKMRLAFDHNKMIKDLKAME